MKPDWTRIRGYWRHHELEILRAGPSCWGVDPYAWDHEVGISMSPIEAALWFDIRLASVVLYPQWPVGRYFVDFANPAAKVAIECDGKAWHTDAHRDAQRQREIEALGWTVYRIGGADCLRDSIESQDEAGRVVFAISPAYRLVKDIAERHGIRLNGRRLYAEAA